MDVFFTLKMFLWEDFYSMCFIAGCPITVVVLLLLHV